MPEPTFLTATRASYDAAAETYATWVDAELSTRPIERSVLSAFVELVQTAGGGTIADIGCGPGRVTSYLSRLGATAIGIDLSTEMIALARRAYPALSFAVGSMLGLDVGDAEYAGVVAWYSIIHVPDDRLADAFAEFRRVLVPGGHLLLAFQVGDEIAHRSEALGVSVDLDFHRRPVDRVAGWVREAGFDIVAQVVKEADPSGPYPEASPQGMLIARLPSTINSKER